MPEEVADGSAQLREAVVADQHQVAFARVVDASVPMTVVVVVVTVGDEIASSVVELMFGSLGIAPPSRSNTVCPIAPIPARKRDRVQPRGMQKVEDAGKRQLKLEPKLEPQVLVPDQMMRTTLVDCPHFYFCGEHCA